MASLLESNRCPLRSGADSPTLPPSSYRLPLYNTNNDNVQLGDEHPSSKESITHDRFPSLATSHKSPAETSYNNPRPSESQRQDLKRRRLWLLTVASLLLGLAGVITSLTIIIQTAIKRPIFIGAVIALPVSAIVLVGCSVGSYMFLGKGDSVESFQVQGLKPNTNLQSQIVNGRNQEAFRTEIPAEPLGRSAGNAGGGVEVKDGRSGSREQQTIGNIPFTLTYSENKFLQSPNPGRAFEYRHSKIPLLFDSEPFVISKSSGRNTSAQATSGNVHGSHSSEIPASTSTSSSPRPITYSERLQSPLPPLPVSCEEDSIQQIQDQLNGSRTEIHDTRPIWQDDNSSPTVKLGSTDPNSRPVYQGSLRALQELYHKVSPQYMQHNESRMPFLGDRVPRLKAGASKTSTQPKSQAPSAGHYVIGSVSSPDTSCDTVAHPLYSSGTKSTPLARSAALENQHQSLYRFDSTRPPQTATIHHLTDPVIESDEELQFQNTMHKTPTRSKHSPIRPSNNFPQAASHASTQNSQAQHYQSTSPSATALLLESPYQDIAASLLYSHPPDSSLISSSPIPSSTVLPDPEDKISADSLSHFPLAKSIGTYRPSVRSRARPPLRSFTSYPSISSQERGTISPGNLDSPRSLDIQGLGVALSSDVDHADQVVVKTNSDRKLSSQAGALVPQMSLSSSSAYRADGNVGLDHKNKARSADRGPSSSSFTFGPHRRFNQMATIPTWLNYQALSHTKRLNRNPIEPAETPTTRTKLPQTATKVADPSLDVKNELRYVTNLESEYDNDGVGALDDKTGAESGGLRRLELGRGLVIRERR